MSKFEQAFLRMASGRDEDIDLARGALLIAGLEYADIDIEHWLSQIDIIAAQASRRLDDISSPKNRVEVLCRYLHDELGFDGNRDDYYDPRNSYLNDVIETRRGIPITLSILYIAVAQRVGIDLVGVGFPAHFIARHRQVDDLFVDAFNGGHVVGREDLVWLLRRLSNNSVAFREEFLEPSSPRAVLVRVLQNLKGIANARGQYLRVIELVDRVLMLEPGLVSEYLARGVSYTKLGAHAFAIEDFERYLEHAPSDNEHRADVEARLEKLRKKPKLDFS